MDFSFLAEAFQEVHLMQPTPGVIFAACLAAVLLVLSGFASGSEIAFFSLSPSDLNEMDAEKSVTDKNIEMLRDDSERTLANILIANNFVKLRLFLSGLYSFLRY